ncbi:MAG: CapA family protein, partial [Paludibacter sp.]|nr:CapA family protein [Paludibacter sp.]
MMKPKLVVLMALCSVLELTAQKKEILKIAAVGDIMLGTAYSDSSFLPKHNAQRLFKPLNAYLQN